MKVSKDKLIWTFKRARIQFRGNYDVVAEDIIKGVLKWGFVALLISPFAIWKILELLGWIG